LAIIRWVNGSVSEIAGDGEGGNCMVVAAKWKNRNCDLVLEVGMDI